MEAIFCILHSAFCILHSAFCIPNSAFCIPNSELRIPHSKSGGRPFQVAAAARKTTLSSYFGLLVDRFVGFTSFLSLLAHF